MLQATIFITLVKYCILLIVSTYIFKTKTIIYLKQNYVMKRQMCRKTPQD